MRKKVLHFLWILFVALVYGQNKSSIVTSFVGPVPTTNHAIFHPEFGLLNLREGDNTIIQYSGYPTSNTQTIFCGQPAQPAASVDGLCTSSSTRLIAPRFGALDSSGNIYISESGAGSTIRKVDGSSRN